MKVCSEVDVRYIPLPDQILQIYHAWSDPIQKDFLTFPALIELQLLNVSFNCIHLRKEIFIELCYHFWSFSQSVEVYFAFLCYYFNDIIEYHKSWLFVDLKYFLFRNENFGSSEKVVPLIETWMINEAFWDDFHFSMNEESRAKRTLIAIFPINATFKDSQTVDKFLNLIHLFMLIQTHFVNLAIECRFSTSTFPLIFYLCKIVLKNVQYSLLIFEFSQIFSLQRFVIDQSLIFIDFFKKYPQWLEESCFEVILSYLISFILLERVSKNFLSSMNWAI